MRIRPSRKDSHASPDDGAAASWRATPVGGEKVTGAHNDPQPHLYRIRVRGRLGQTIRSAFPALQARESGGDTVLTGPRQVAPIIPEVHEREGAVWLTVPGLTE